MNDPRPQSTLREWRAHMGAPTRLAVFAAIAVILAIMGPFNTIEVLSFIPRLAYWAVISVACYAAGYTANLLVEHRLRAFPRVAKAALTTLITAIGVLCIIMAINGAFLGYWPTGRDLGLLVLNIAVISAVITLAFQFTENSNRPDAPLPPALLDRLSMDKRAPLVSLSVEDHYVRIRTTKGEDMVLLRLADAMREVGDTAGLQVHRSHWVAIDQVTNATRKGDGAILTMAHGPDIPVSRANVPAIREVGLLPR